MQDKQPPEETSSHEQTTQGLTVSFIYTNLCSHVQPQQTHTFSLTPPKVDKHFTYTNTYRPSYPTGFCPTLRPLGCWWLALSLDLFFLLASAKRKPGSSFLSLWVGMEAWLLMLAPARLSGSCNAQNFKSFL